MDLSKKRKSFSEFLPHFKNLYQNLIIFKKLMTLIAYVIFKLRTVKTWLEKCLKSSVLVHSLTIKMLSLLSDFSFTLKEMELKNESLGPI